MLSGSNISPCVKIKSPSASMDTSIIAPKVAAGAKFSISIADESPSAFGLSLMPCPATKLSFCALVKLDLTAISPST